VNGFGRDGRLLIAPVRLTKSAAPNSNALQMVKALVEPPFTRKAANNEMWQRQFGR